MGEITKSQENAISKIVKSELITSIYPMIKDVEVKYLDSINTLLLKIYVDDIEMTSHNMYERGLDPHYLIDKHLAGIFPYLNIPRNIKIGFTVIEPQGNSIHSYIPYA
jgi:hypothetical protein